MPPTSNIDGHPLFYRIKQVDGWVMCTSMFVIECPLRLDTGAAVSLIDHRQTYLSIAASRRPPVHPIHTQLQTADGGQMELFGDPTVALAFNGFHTSQDVMVADQRERGGILGLYFLLENGCEMSMRDWLLKIGPTN